MVFIPLRMGSALRPAPPSHPQISVLGTVPPPGATLSLIGGSSCTLLVIPWYTCGLLIDLPGGWFRLPSDGMSNPPVGFVPCGDHRLQLSCGVHWMPQPMVSQGALVPHQSDSCSLQHCLAERERRQALWGMEGTAGLS